MKKKKRPASGTGRSSSSKKIGLGILSYKTTREVLLVGNSNKTTSSSFLRNFSRALRLPQGAGRACESVPNSVVLGCWGASEVFHSAAYCLFRRVVKIKLRAP